jgi:hypothetical protein
VLCAQNWRIDASSTKCCGASARGTPGVAVAGASSRGAAVQKSLLVPCSYWRVACTLPRQRANENATTIPSAACTKRCSPRMSIAGDI